LTRRSWEGLYEDQALGRGRRRRRTWVQVCNLHKHHASQAFPQIENLRPRKNAAADGTLVDAARGQALASRFSCHRVFRSRGPFEPGPGVVRGQVYPDSVAVTFFPGGAARTPPVVRRASV
jgi:hypothetical protein